jgi:hypothetical protein
MTDPALKLRWYRLTPHRIVVGLLIVEGLLWLSERFQWFGFGCTREMQGAIYDKEFECHN